MSKRLVSVLLVVCLVFALAVPGFAADKTVNDIYNLLTQTSASSPTSANLIYKIWSLLSTISSTTTTISTKISNQQTTLSSILSTLGSGTSSYNILGKTSNIDSTLTKLYTAIGAPATGQVNLNTSVNAISSNIGKILDDTSGIPDDFDSLLRYQLSISNNTGSASTRLGYIQDYLADMSPHVSSIDSESQGIHSDTTSINSNLATFLDGWISSGFPDLVPWYSYNVQDAALYVSDLQFHDGLADSLGSVVDASGRLASVFARNDDIELRNKQQNNIDALGSTFISGSTDSSSSSIAPSDISVSSDFSKTVIGNFSSRFSRSDSIFLFSLLVDGNDFSDILCFWTNPDWFDPAFSDTMTLSLDDALADDVYVYEPPEVIDFTKYNTSVSEWLSVLEDVSQ